MSHSITDVTSIGDWAKKVDISAANVQAWLSKEGDNNIPQPVMLVGRTRLYLISDLEKLAADNASGQVMRKLGYIHPDKYAELESSYQEAVRLGISTRDDLEEADRRIEALDVLVESLRAQIEALRAQESVSDRV